MSQCKQCNKNLNTSPIIVSCVVCNNMFHGTAECAGLTASELKVIELKKKPCMVYKCKECHDKGNVGLAEAINNLSSKMEKQKKEVITQFKDTIQNLGSNVKAQMESIKAQINDLNGQISDMGGTIESLKLLESSIPDMQEKIVALQSEIDSLKTSNNSNNSSVVENKTIIEIQDRIERSKNIILYNVPDNGNSGTNGENDKAKAVLSKVGIDLTRINSRRIGAYVATGTHPLIVMLNSAQDAHTVLKNRSKIDKGIMVSLDKTKLQQLQYKNVKAELVSRIRAGESNLVIRYIDNVPTVVRKPNQRDPLYMNQYGSAPSSTSSKNGLSSLETQVI